MFTASDILLELACCTQMFFFFIVETIKCVTVNKYSPEPHHPMRNKDVPLCFLKMLVSPPTHWFKWRAQARGPWQRKGAFQSLFPHFLPLHLPTCEVSLCYRTSRPWLSGVGGTSGINGKESRVKSGDLGRLVEGNCLYLHVFLKLTDVLDDLILIHSASTRAMLSVCCVPGWC